MREVIITWKASKQISPEDFRIYTKVVICNPNETLRELHNRITKDCTNKQFDAEIHFNQQ